LCVSKLDPRDRKKIIASNGLAEVRAYIGKGAK